MPRRVLGYARVSSEEQALGTSLRDQQASMAAYAKSIGLAVTRFFVEAESSLRERIESRHEMRALMKDVGRGDLVLCDKLDRWSRDPEFSYASIRQIRERGASFYAVSDRCDPATNEGDTMLNFRVLFAREEHKRIRERTVGARKTLKAQGMFSEGRVPFGYRRAAPKGAKLPTKNVLVVEPREAELVRRMFTLCASGRSLRQIGAALADEGLSCETVERVLRNRVYLGEMRGLDGTWIKGQHEAIVDADLFSRAADSRAARRITGARTRDVPSQTDTWILREVAHCDACGRKLAATYGPRRLDGSRAHYYRCPNKCLGYVSVRNVEGLMIGIVVRRLFELRGILGQEPEPRRAETVDYAAKRQALTTKRMRYLEAYADGHMTRPALGAAIAKVDAEITRLDAAEVAEKKTSPLTDVTVRRSLLGQLRELERAWRLAEPVTMRRIVRALASTVRVGPRGPAPVWRTTEELVESV